MVTSNPRFVCESADMSRSSFVNRARFCSEDPEVGYLIVNLNGRDYIHDRVPRRLWRDFRSAPSFGSFYTAKIRGLYPLQLGDSEPKATAICKDGSSTYIRTRQGACSGHGGVARWLN